MNRLLSLSSAALMVAAYLPGACKKQPVRSVSPEQDIHVSKFLGLASHDGNLRSYASKSDASPCLETQGHPFAFIAGERRFYRCVLPSLQLIGDSLGDEPQCRSFELAVDVASTGGAVSETNVKFFGLSCDGSSYLIKSENGLIPELFSARVDLGDKEIVMRASYIHGKSEADEPIAQSSSLFLERATSIRWSKFPLVIEISPGGHAGFGSFAFLSMNSDAIVCSFKTDTAEIYRLQKCAEGGRQDVTQQDGISGGLPIDMNTDNPVSVDSMKFVMAGAKRGYITSAVVAIPIE